MGSWIPPPSNQSRSSQSFPMSNVLPGIDRFHNLLTSYLLSNPSLPICHLSPSSNSMHLTKANRKIADNLDQVVGILDCRMPMKTMRRNALVAYGLKRPNSSGKVREIKHLPLLSPITMLSLGFLPSLNSQIVVMVFLSFLSSPYGLTISTSTYGYNITQLPI